MSMARKLLARSVVMLALSMPVLAADTDLFMVTNTNAGDVPNLLIILDNAANFSSSAANCTYTGGAAPSLNGTAGGIEQCAFHNVIEGLPVGVGDKPLLNIGMMVYNANNIRDISGVNCGGPNAKGGCLVVPLMPMNTANKASMLSFIKSWRTSGGAGNGYIKANGQATGAVMQEAWAYFKGQVGLSGRSYAPGVISPSNCANNYVVFVANAFDQSGKPGEGGSASPYTALENAPGATVAQKTPISGSFTTTCGVATSTSFPATKKKHEEQGVYGDEWSRYMLEVEEITTYSIGLINPSTCKPEYPALLHSMAEDVGGGKYFETDNYQELAIAFSNVLSEIQSVNTVFASVSLPVSVNPQGTLLNQVFIGMFRPDPAALPRWYGNLKQYRLGFTEGDASLKLLDADDAAAISSGNTGFIAECARSEWTPLKSSPDQYWETNDVENCAGFDKRSNTPDGNLVEKGGQAYTAQDLTPGSRTVYTCDSSCGQTVQSLTTGNITNTAVTNAALGVSTNSDRDLLINWIRGTNNVLKPDGTSAEFGNLSLMRPSSHGDVVHSRPVAINYGTDAAPNVVVFYGANDGMLRAINGNRDARSSSGAVVTGNTIRGVPPGHEIWSFLPPEFYNDITRLRSNEVEVSYPGSPSLQQAEKPYAMDGPLAAFQGSIDGTDRVIVFAPMRRGGRAIYAFDVSNVGKETGSAVPELLWRRGCDESGGNCTSADYSNIGQTWSPVAVTKARGYLAGPLAIFGGGYDTCHDADPQTCTTASVKGNRIFVLDAQTGTLLKSFSTASSVVGGVTVVPDSSGAIQYAYAADLGGNVYRLGSGADAKAPIGSTAPSSWEIESVAALGGSGIDNRKFMFSPDVVQTSSGEFALLLGSGDREKPVLSYSNAASVDNYFFMLKDSPSNAQQLADCGNSTVICLDALTSVPRSGTPNAEDLATSRGWFLELNNTEQVVTSAITISNTVTFSTQQPSSGLVDCEPSLGTTNVYNVNYLDAAPVGQNPSRYEPLLGGGLPPSPVAGVVRIGDRDIPFLIGGSSKSALEGGLPSETSEVSMPKGRVYWHVQE